ncbi:NAD(P)/FAD-dependent oxidoreductase [Streptomyces sp.]|uniref:NAD(P)/FAD-dependent oxidoreductase n=1 Tax=Streptomyces sp. TaxID=1931 RepID=UPI002811E41B|nr:NAD(P)/FAD-dependent oxidoreductase [Streptomyces sp.]
MTGVDVLVIGAGPAGLAAARAARTAGARVVLLDASDVLGGQYWRHPLTGARDADVRALQHQWPRFVALRAALTDDPDCEVVTGAQVWAVDRRDDAPPVVHVLTGPADGGDRPRRVLAPRAVVLATGAHERTLPFPGWDLPGVHTAGAAQAMAKGEHLAVGGRVLVAGTGPFLLPVAAGLLHVGATVVGVVEAGSLRRMARGWLAPPYRTRPAVLAAKSAELGGYVRALAAARVPYRTGAAVLAAHGDSRVTSVTVSAIDEDWTPRPGTGRRVAVDAVCVSHAFVPRTEIAVSAGCALTADGSVRVDATQRTSVPGVYAAGEITGIGGADLALAEGEVAGRAAAGRATAGGNVAGGDGGAAEVRRLRNFADRMHRAHGIRPGWRSWVEDDTVVCRCEEVTAGRVRAAQAATGTRGLRSLKLSSRAGLGICQGRVCGRNLEELLPEVPLDAGRTANRPIVVPVRLGEIATPLAPPPATPPDPPVAPSVEREASP